MTPGAGVPEPAGPAAQEEPAAPVGGTQTVARQVVRLTKGAKLAGVAGLLLIIMAAFLFLVPLEKPTSSGQSFRCGTAVNPADGAFARAICEGQVRRYQLGGVAFALAGVVVAVGAGSVFGVERRLEQRTSSRAG